MFNAYHPCSAHFGLNQVIQQATYATIYDNGTGSNKILGNECKEILSRHGVMKVNPLSK